MACAGHEPGALSIVAVTAIAVGIAVMAAAVMAVVAVWKAKENSPL